MLCGKWNLFFILVCCVSLSLTGCSTDDPGAGSEDTGLTTDTGESSDSSPGEPDAPIDDSGGVDDADETEDADSSDATDITDGQDGGAPTFDWQVGSWSECSENCGGGTQTRDVWCESDDGKQANDAACSEPKPEESQSCNTHTCTEECPPGVNICNATSESDCNVALNEAREECINAGCTPSGPTECTQGGSPSNPNCWGAVVECN
jgi:hypothetical protein